MEIINILIIIVFFLLLAVSIYTVVNWYVCDGESCKPFKIAKEKGAPGTKEFTIALLEESSKILMWSLPYITASVITPISLWFIQAQFTIQNFFLAFFVSFIVILCAFSFLINHHIQLITSNVSDFIKDYC